MLARDSRSRVKVYVGFGEGGDSETPPRLPNIRFQIKAIESKEILCYSFSKIECKTFSFYFN